MTVLVPALAAESIGRPMLRSGPRAPRLSALSLALACTLPALLFGYGGYVRRWAGDDGFINFRVVRQLMEGNGFVYNAGERVEAVTSALWVLVLWALGELGCNLESAAWVASLSAGVLGMALAALAAARLARRDDSAVVLPFGVLAYAALPVAWDYATSALENGLTVLYLGGGFFAMSRALEAKRRRTVPAIAALVGLGPLVRPDLALYAAPWLLILLLVSSGLRTRAWVALSGALPAVAYQVFRMGYFACLVPNTAIAKEAFASNWPQGLLYFANTYDTYALRIPLALSLLVLSVVLVSLTRRRELARAAVVGSLASAGALQMLYVVRLGGDFMHGRMLLPGLFALFAAVGVLQVAPVRSRYSAAGALAVVLMAAWAVHCASSLRVPIFADQILDERRWYADTSQSPHPTHLEHYKGHLFYGGPRSVRERVAKGCPRGDASLSDDAFDLCTRLAQIDGSDGLLSDHADSDALPLAPGVLAPSVMGLFGFRPLGIAGNAVGLRIAVIDSYGLADSLASRTEQGPRLRAGHEKFFSTYWFAAKFVADGATQDERVLTAKRALRCTPLRQLHAATHAPMTVKRFFRNMQLSFRLHSLRVPTDPHEAVRRFCS
jgi:arabinofuranosyltransferase